MRPDDDSEISYAKMCLSERRRFRKGLDWTIRVFAVTVFEFNNLMSEKTVL